MQDTDDSGGEEVLDNGSTDTKKIAVAPWIAEEIRFLWGIVQKSINQGLKESEHQKSIRKFQKSKNGRKKSEQSFIEQALNNKISREVQGHQEALTNPCIKILTPETHRAASSAGFTHL